MDDSEVIVETNFDLAPWDESTKVVLKFYNDRNDVDVENDSSEGNVLTFPSDDLENVFFDIPGVYFEKELQRELILGLEGSAISDFKVKIISIETNGRQDYP